MDDAPNHPDAGYYSGRPLNYDAQHAAATALQPAVGEQAANALPVAPQPQPPPDAGENANHTHVHGVPGYYKGRVNKRDTAAVPPPPAAAAPTPASATAPAPPAAATAELEKEQSYIKKLLMCFKGGKGKK